MPGGLWLWCHAACQALSAIRRREHAAFTLACLASAQGCSMISTTKVTCDNCAGRGAKAGRSRFGHPGCSCQHSPSPFPQAQASAHRCPGHTQACPDPSEVHAFPPSALCSIARLVVTQACTAPCGVHVFPPLALRSLASVGGCHTCVSCYCSCRLSNA